MMHLTSHITISTREGEFVSEKIVSAEITRDMEKLTDECKLSFPGKKSWDFVPVSRGDKVTVALGYKKPELLFTGYVREIKDKAPFTMTCEDEMYALKLQQTEKKAYTSVTLSQLLSDQNIPYKINVMGEQSLGQYRVTEDTVAEMLSSLQKNGISSFFRLINKEPVLYSGVIFDRDSTPSQVFETGVNIINDDDLNWSRAEDQKIKLTAISLLPDNSKIKIEVGDDDGEARTVNTYNKTEAELREWAEQELDRIKVDGLTGSFQTFGHKIVDILDVIGMKIDGEKKGVYQVKKNVIKFGTSGFRQEITLGLRTAE